MTDSSGDCAEALDPRVQIELEELNSATDEINRLEVELDEARLVFRRLLAEGHLRIQQLTRKLGTSVHKARPYYEARFRANLTSQELHTANLAYDKANSAHTAAREMVFLAEQGLARLAEGSEGGVTLDPAWQEMLNHATSRVNQVFLAEQGLARLAEGSEGGVTLDPAWQEMLNHATSRVNQAEADRASASLHQRARAATHRAAAALVQQLQGGLKRHITKSRPYFEEKARINASLEAQKARIQTLEQQVTDSKQRYSAALRNLERISEDIHRHRSRRQSAKCEIKLPSPTIDTDDTSTNNSSDKLSSLCSPHDANVRAWLLRVDAGPGRDDNWTEIDLDYSSPEEVSFEKCSLRARSPRSPASPESPAAPRQASAAEPRLIIRRQVDRSARLRAEVENGRRQSLDALLQDTGEKVKEMFHGFSLFGARRGSGSAPRTPRRGSGSAPRTPRRGASPSRSAHGSEGSDDRHSDTDSLHSVEMLTDEQIASLMLDAQLEAVCDRLAGIAVRPATSPSEAARY